jgi:hypothetical protein
MCRLQENLFSMDDVSNTKIEMLYSILMERASYKNDETRGIVTRKSIKPMYTIFGRMNMSRYLQKLEEIGLIEILSKAKNHNDDGCIKIKHYDKIQSLKSYYGCDSDTTVVIPKSCASVINSLQPSFYNDESKLEVKKEDVIPVLHRKLVVYDDHVTLPACSYIEENKNINNVIKNTVTTCDTTSPDINFYDPDSLAIAPSKPVKIAKSKKIIPEGKSVETVNAYKLAYKSKYGVDPIINAATRGQACKLVDSVGKDVAPKLAQFYLTHNAQWYVRNLHKFGLLLSDAEKLHTEMQKGEYMTESMARKADKDSHEQSMMDEIQRKIDSGYYQLDDD